MEAIPKVWYPLKTPKISLIALGSGDLKVDCGYSQIPAPIQNAKIVLSHLVSEIVVRWGKSPKSATNFNHPALED